MNEEKWEVIKFKFEQTLKSWELDKKTNQFTVDSIHSLFPTEIEVIVNYIEDLQKQNAELKKENKKYKQVIDKLENLIKKEYDYSKKDCVPARKNICEKILDILKEVK